MKTRQSVAGYSKYAAGAIATHSSGRKNIDLNPSTQPSLDLAIKFETVIVQLNAKTFCPVDGESIHKLKNVSPYFL